MTSIPKAQPARQRPKWHWVYFALAAFNIVTIGLSIYLNHRVVDVFSSSITENQTWTSRLHNFSLLGPAAVDVNAPGNDVFDSGNVPTEKARLDAALAAFRKQVQLARQQVSGIGAQYAARINNELDDVDRTMDDMVAEARQIFAFFEQKQTVQAGQRMATMDRKYGHVAREIDELREVVLNIQSEILTGQQTRAHRLRVFENILATAMIFLVIGTVLFGMNLARRADETARRSSEQLAAVQASEDRYRDLFENASDLIQSVTPEGKFIYVNKRWRETMGYGEDELSRMTLFDVIEPQSIPHCRDMMGRLQSEGKLDEVQVVFVTKHGQKIWLLGNVTGRFEDGKMTATRGIFRDVSERKRMEEELIRARDEAVSASKLKSEFLANMSHEIRTPMNGVIGMTSLLLDTPLSRQQREFTHTIRESSESLLTVINDILDFSKMEAGKLMFEMMDFELREIVENSLEIVAGTARAKRLELAGLVEVDAPNFLRSDAGRLRQILINLLNNAIKFTAKGEVFLRVSLLDQTASHAMLRFEIKDTGIGIAPENQQRLFAAFAQADTSTTRKYGGTGLGLAISKQLVRIMGGEIGVQSVPGEGSTFWFTGRFEKQLNPQPESREKMDLAGLRVLVVDDNETNRRIMHSQISGWRMHPLLASAPSEGLAIMRYQAQNNIPCDLAILDLQMPDMDGLSLAKTIKEDPILSRTRLLILSSLGDQIPPEILKASGVEGCLLKPVKQSRLFDAIGRAMLQNQAGLEPEAAAPAAKPPQQHTRVLLAEDNSVNQKVAIGQLARLGYTADVAGNGLEVLEALQQIPYEVIFMDCQMPELDGYETARRIRAQAGPSRIRPYIIAMTAHAMQGDREKCLDAGMDDYISKPVRPKDLKDALERWKTIATSKSPEPVPTSHLSPLAASAATSAPLLVDFERMADLAGDAAGIHGLVGDYFQQAEELLAELALAVEKSSAADIAHVAHKWCGSSSTCGMDALVAPLRRLEDIGNSNELDAAAELLAEVRVLLARLRCHFDKNLAVVYPL